MKPDQRNQCPFRAWPGRKLPWQAGILAGPCRNIPSLSQAAADSRAQAATRSLFMSCWKTYRRAAASLPCRPSRPTAFTRYAAAPRFMPPLPPDFHSPSALPSRVHWPVMTVPLREKGGTMHRHRSLCRQASRERIHFSGSSIPQACTKPAGSTAPASASLPLHHGT